MRQRILLIVGGIIFALVAAAHIARILMQTEVVIGGWTLPMWGSVPAALILILLAFLFFRAAGK
ncbi:MAG: hypothetical protein Q9M29_05855 [Mariprofundaceae bacterium]|nr:hypothetical protein [Mariprofundaceae bacterium]